MKSETLRRFSLKRLLSSPDKISRSDTPPAKTTWWGKNKKFLLPVIIALVFLVFTFLYYPFREKIQFDGDEGLNLMRSMLVVLGHPLYTEVSSDQPPLLTMLLATVMRMTGFKVVPDRFLILLFSSLLVWACTQFLELTWGDLAAVLFLPLVVMAPRYLVLSVSVMIGLPSIALATVSMLLIVVWHRDKRDLWLILSGVLLALSVLIKLFTGFVAPIFLVGITISTHLERKDRGFSFSWFRPALVWSLSFGLLLAALVLLWVGPANVWQLIFPHLEAPTEATYQGERYTINYHLQAAVPLLLLSLLGVWSTIYRRKWLSLYPLIWGILAYTLLSFYSPVLYHHQLLVTIPAAMLAAIGVAEGILFFLRAKPLSGWIRFQGLVGAVAVIGFVLVGLHYWPTVNGQLSNHPSIRGESLQATAGKLKVLNTMSDYIDQTHWIVTDMPMYAYLVKRPVPPILATFSRKRLVTGSLTDEDILTAVREYNPEQVLMARFTIPALNTYLESHYTLIASPEFFRLYLRNDILSATK
jgi:4-amino-4-deoxy-L-arabinose transferase-like glycosyltransferase